jgi:hypothetical protein
MIDPIVLQSELKKYFDNIGVDLQSLLSKTGWNLYQINRYNYKSILNFNWEDSAEGKLFWFKILVELEEIFYYYWAKNLTYDLNKNSSIWEE